MFVNKSSAEYIDHMGSDLTVVNAARVSFDKHVEFFGEKDERLIKYLASHNHWTPFSHCVVTLRITAPIFLARQLFKHKIGFVENEVSRRYVDTPPEFYHPTEWRARADNKKQGSSDETVPLVEARKGETYDPSAIYDDVVFACEKVYKVFIDNGICPEQARMVLPQSMMTSWYWTGSLNAWARAYNLRTDEHSQKEHLQLFGEVDKIISNLFPVSWKYLTKISY